MYDPQVYNNKQKLQNLYSAVKAICPLLNNHKEIKEMSLIHNSTVEIQAADAVLDFVLNDTCNWVSNILYSYYRNDSALLFRFTLLKKPVNSNVQ